MLISYIKNYKSLQNFVIDMSSLLFYHMNWQYLIQIQKLKLEIPTLARTNFKTFSGKKTYSLDISVSTTKFTDT